MSVRRRSRRSALRVISVWRRTLTLVNRRGCFTFHLYIILSLGYVSNKPFTYDYSTNHIISWRGTTSFPSYLLLLLLNRLVVSGVCRLITRAYAYHNYISQMTDTDSRSLLPEVFRCAWCWIICRYSTGRKRKENIRQTRRGRKTVIPSLPGSVGYCLC